MCESLRRSDLWRIEVALEEYIRDPANEDAFGSNVMAKYRDTLSRVEEESRKLG